MLSQIVFTEKVQIVNLKVIDELKHGNIQQEMQTIEKRFSLNNNQREVTLDLKNLQVKNLKNQDLLGLIIKHVFL